MRPELTIKHPSFRIHRSVTRFCLPLSRFARLPSNQCKVLVVGALIICPPSTRDLVAHSEDKTRILLVRRAAIEKFLPNIWEIPGGKAEYGIDQTLLETVVREVKEETGLKVTGIKGEFEGFEYEGSKGKCKQYNFIVEVASESEELRLDPEEHQEYLWIGRDSDLGGLEMTDSMRKVVLDGFKALAKETERKINACTTPAPGDNSRKKD